MNPRWNSLPTYSTYNPSSTAVLTGLCSIHGTKHRAATATGPGSSTNGTVGVGSHISRPGSAINLSGHPSAVGMADMNGLPLPPGLGGADTGISSVPGSSSGLYALGQAGGSAHGPMRRPEGDDTLLERNIVYDRLMSGQETEEGEMPPTYEAAASATAAVGSSGGLGSGSASRRGSAVALAPEHGGRRDASPGVTPRGRPTLLRGESEDDGAVVMGSTSSSRSRGSRERRGRAGQVSGEAGDRSRSKSRLRTEVL